ncbi:16522_t:CDS:2, partial [Funneliformis geosporum]
FFKTYDISNEIIDENFNKENKEDFEITDASEEENNDKLIDMKVSQARYEMIILEDDSTFDIDFIYNNTNEIDI